mmetsp:Transcript_73476/g.202808  ORF Transcript_73476/g.202808 Transcript_73476/m.202808 type:complete len:272 (-) Transcript_73476:1729-2544(-)
MLALNVYLVDCLVHHCDVVRLHVLQVWQDEREVPSLPDLLHHTCVVHLGRQCVEQRVQQHGLLVQVELHRAVVELSVGNLLHDHLEVVVREGRGAVCHHGVGSLVVLVVVRVEVHSVLPVVVALAGLDELWDVQLRDVQLDEVHELLRLVLRIQPCKLGVHANVRVFAVEATIQQAHELFETTALLVLGDELLQVVRMHNDVHASNLRATELLGLHTCNVNLLPCLGVVGLPCSLHCLGVLAKLNMTGGKLRGIRDGLVKDLCGLVGLFVV